MKSLSIICRININASDLEVRSLSKKIPLYQTLYNNVNRVTFKKSIQLSLYLSVFLDCSKFFCRAKSVKIILKFSALSLVYTELSNLENLNRDIMKSFDMYDMCYFLRCTSHWLLPWCTYIPFLLSC